MTTNDDSVLRNTLETISKFQGVTPAYIPEMAAVALRA